MLRSPLPTIAAVNGPAVGAGMNLALACDVRLVGDSARFDARFLQIGLHPGGGHTWMLDRAVGPQAAAAIVLFGERSTAPARSRSASRGRATPTTSSSTAASALGARAAKVPKALSAGTKRTPSAAVPWQPSFDAALATEIEHQTWSFTQGWFNTPKR